MRARSLHIHRNRNVDYKEIARNVNVLHEKWLRLAKIQYYIAEAIWCPFFLAWFPFFSFFNISLNFHKKDSDFKNGNFPHVKIWIKSGVMRLLMAHKMFAFDIRYEGVCMLMH